MFQISSAGYFSLSLGHVSFSQLSLASKSALACVGPPQSESEVARPHPLDDLRGLALAILDGVLGNDLPLADLLGRPLHDARVAHLVLQQPVGLGPPRNTRF